MAMAPTTQMSCRSRPLMTNPRQRDLDRRRRYVGSVRVQVLPAIRRGSARAEPLDQAGELAWIGVHPAAPSSTADRSSGTA